MCNRVRKIVAILITAAILMTVMLPVLAADDDSNVAAKIIVGTSSVSSNKTATVKIAVDGMGTTNTYNTANFILTYDVKKVSVNTSSVVFESNKYNSPTFDIATPGAIYVNAYAASGTAYGDGPICSVTFNVLDDSSDINIGISQQDAIPTGKMPFLQKNPDIKYTNITGVAGKIAASKSALQELLLAGIQLPTTSRSAFTAILNNVTTSSISASALEVLDLLDDNKITPTPRQSSIEEGLQRYAEYPNKTTKENVIFVLTNLDAISASSGCVTTASALFPDILKVINSEITGDSTDSRGYDLFYKMLSLYETKIGYKPVAFDDATTPSSIDFNYTYSGTTPTAITSFNSMIGMLQSLNSKGINDFASLLSYCETDVNGITATNRDVQIANFKAELGTLGAYEASSTKSSDTEISSSVYNVDQTNKIITKAVWKTTVTSFSSSIIAANKGSIEVYEKDGTTLASGNMGTGMKVKSIAEDGTIAWYTVIVYGDVNGDKNINITDATLIMKKIANAYTFDSVATKAANVNGDAKTDGSENINITDATLVMKRIANAITKFSVE